MKTYHFNIQISDLSADVSLGGEWTLYEFAEFIIKTVGFDFDHPFEFHDDPMDPYRSKERYSLFADLGEGEDANDAGVKETLVSAVFREGREMGFLFDYGDDWGFRVTCTRVAEDPKAKRRFRKVLATSGEPPVQYPDVEDD